MIIGLSGKIGTGKTELSKLILKHQDADRLPCVRIAFGDLLKDKVAAEFGFPLEWCYSQEGKERVVKISLKKYQSHIQPASDLTISTGGREAKVRTILQWYGTEWKREQDPEYWIWAMREAVSQKVHNGYMVVVDDVRFPNEKALIAELGGLNIRLHPWAGWQSGPYADHPSETALDDPRESWNLVLHGPHLSQLPKIAQLIIRIAMLRKWRLESTKNPKVHPAALQSIDRITDNTIRFTQRLTQGVEIEDIPAQAQESREPAP